VAVPRKKAVLTLSAQGVSNFLRFAAVNRSRGVDTVTSPASESEYTNEEGYTCEDAMMARSSSSARVYSDARSQSYYKKGQ
jgi:hypothetical protein